MLEQALKVVEAARAMKLERKGKLSGSAITDRLTLAKAIDGLREAIEEFDAETARGLSSPAHIARPDFATPPQLDERGFVERQDIIEARTATPGLTPSPEAEEVEELSETGPEFAATMKAFTPSISIPAASLTAGMDYLNTADLGDMEFNDGTESVADFLESLDAIQDKLEHVVAKVGWTPRLRALAEAANVAKRKMFLDVAHDGYFVRIPAHSWSTLTVALADAVTDRDNNMTIPVPKPAPAYDARLDDRYAPKPPGYA